MGDETGHVRGIGGTFFKCDDPQRTLAWYREHLGLDIQEWGGTAFRWPHPEDSDASGYTVWSAFPRESGHFGPGTQDFMFNFRVHAIGVMIESLRANGVEIAGEIESHPNGKFAWIVDPDGRRVELWEPVPIDEDPYI